ncbi:MAG: glycoside hydrolase family 28 protein [Isosphaeraceae bacterium]
MSPHPESAAESETRSTFSVRDFGASGDGVTLDTGAIQAAIDACTARGGGTVFLPPGDYLTGTITLKDNVTLHVGPSARLLGSTSLADYPSLKRGGMFGLEYLDRCLIDAYRAHHIALTGEGCVDGQGAAFPYGEENYNFEDLASSTTQQSFVRPTLLRFSDCRDVTISNLTLQHAASWCCNLERCKEMRLHGLHLVNRANQNNDGFDLNQCEDVMISDCHLDCGDDAIALQDGGLRIVVTNCVISSRWSAVRLGPASLGVFRDIAVSNCVIYDTYGAPIKIQEVEGGVMENISFDNLVMDHVTGPISLRLGGYLGWRNERKESLPIGVLRNIHFSNIRAVVADDAYPLPHEVPAFPGEKKSCLSITGVPGFFVENVSFSGMHLTFPGGGSREDAQRSVPELRDHYPEYHMFGTLPAYGFYLRHVKGLTFEDVTVDVAAPDLRPAVVGEDVEDLELSGFRAAGGGAQALMCLRDARQVYVHGCRPLNDVPVFLSVEGAGSREILLQANDLRRVGQTWALADGARPEAIHEG